MEQRNDPTLAREEGLRMCKLLQENGDNLIPYQEEKILKFVSESNDKIDLIKLLKTAIDDVQDGLLELV